jgi:tryptophan-rich hypothetical protein
MKKGGRISRSTGNVLNPKKLLHSKWTSVNPVIKEKHFVVTVVDYDEGGAITQCLIEAVITGRSFPINWRTLGNRDEWVYGWC